MSVIINGLVNIPPCALVAEHPSWLGGEGRERTHKVKEGLTLFYYNRVVAFDVIHQCTYEST